MSKNLNSVADNLDSNDFNATNIEIEDYEITVITRKNSFKKAVGRYWSEERLLFSLCLTGIYIALGVVSRLILSWLPLFGNPPMAISPSTFVMPILCFLCTKYVWSLALSLITPFLWFAFGLAARAGIGELALSHLIPYGFGSLFYFLNYLLPKNKETEKFKFNWWITLVMMLFMFGLMAVVRIIFSSISGMEYYRSPTFSSALIYVGPNIGLDFGVGSAVIISTYPVLLALNKMVYQNK